MIRSTRCVLLLAAACVASACGEPFVVLGDAPTLMRVVLGVGDSVGTRVDSIATRTKLTEPSAVVFHAALSFVYAADRGALRQVGGISTRVARIFAVTSNGRSRIMLDAGGCNVGPCILQVTAMVLAADGSLILADAISNRVLRYPPFGQTTVLAGTGAAASAPDGVVANVSPILRPSGVAIGPNGTIYIAEAGTHRVRSIAADGILRTFAGTGTAGHSGNGGPATAAQLNEPSGLAFHDGVLYIAENLGSIVRAVDQAGVIGTVAGIAGAPGFEGDGGPALDARLDRPFALAITPDGGTLYISDQGNERVRAVDLATGTISTFAGTGSRVWTGNRRLAGETSLATPAGLDASANGFLFIADRGHSVFWRTSISAN